MVRRILWRYVEFSDECMAGRTGYELMDFFAGYQGGTVGTLRGGGWHSRGNLADVHFAATEVFR